MRDLKRTNLVKVEGYENERQGAKLLGQFLKLLLIFFVLLGMIHNEKQEVMATSSRQEANVTGIRLNYKEEQLNIGDGLRLKAKLVYSDQSVVEIEEPKRLKWISSNPTIAQVSSTGKITAKAPGEAKIKVMTEDGSYSASCTIKVKQPCLSKTSLTIYAGENYYLYVRNGNGQITWKSSDASIVKVSANGKVTGVKAGEATITVTRSGVVMKCKVKVKKVKMNVSSIALYEGQNYGLSIVRTQKDILWSSANKKIATVSAKGKVTAKSVGTTTITAKIGNQSYTCKVTVKKSKLQVGKTSVTLDTKGKHKISITCLSMDWKKVKIEVEDKNVIQVELINKEKEQGTISILPKKAGTTNIRIYRTLAPEDDKVIQVTVKSTAISEPPNLMITMSEQTNKSTDMASLTIQNLGTQKLTILKDAYSYDFDYSGYDRSMRLMKTKANETINKKNIGAGKTATVRYQIQGKKTWYDKKTKYYIYIQYDGLDYEIITSYFLGTTIRLL